MRELIFRGVDRTLYIKKTNDNEKFITLIEDLEGDVETVTLSYDEVFKAVALIFDTI